MDRLRTSPPPFPLPPPAVDLSDALTTPPIGASLGSNYNPTFTWKKVDAATYYRLYLPGPAGLVKDQWYQASATCNASSCSVSDITVGGGTHTWYVDTYNSAGVGPWSQAANFSTSTTPPAAVDLRDALTSPTHNASLGINYNPTLTWKKVNEARWYRLSGQLAEAERTIRRLLAYDPLSEAAYRQLMRVLARADQRSAKHWMPTKPAAACCQPSLAWRQPLKP